MSEDQDKVTFERNKKLRKILRTAFTRMHIELCTELDKDECNINEIRGKLSCLEG